MSFFDELWNGQAGEAKRLRWLPEAGVGFFEIEKPLAPYGPAYWQRYRKMDRTPAAEALTESRISLFRRHVSADAQEGKLCVDVGIGGGRFLEQAPGNWRGFDVNPCALDYLTGRGSYFDPYRATVDVASFWDSLEHIADPRPLLANVLEFAFVSIPIFTGPEHVLRSRHYRKDEHFWYFTRTGFVGFMLRMGFECLECNRMEQEAGREDIESFAFRRVRTP